MSSLERLLDQMLNERPPRPRRLPGGLGLRYTPPAPGDRQQLHTLSLSRRDHIDPSNVELRIVYEALVRLRPHARRALYSRAKKGDRMIRRIWWREDDDNPQKKKEDKTMPELTTTPRTAGAA